MKNEFTNQLRKQNLLKLKKVEEAAKISEKLKMLKLRKMLEAAKI